MSIPARKLSGICEISTASFTVTNMPKVHEGENGAIEVSIRFLNNGQPYSLDAYIVEMYLLYQSQNIMTDAVELSVSSNTATGTMPEEFMTRSGCPLLVVRIKDPDSGQQVVAFHLPVHVENVLGQTVITTRPPTPSEVVYIGRSPYINESNHHWMVWDGESSQFKDSGVSATGPQGPVGPAGSVTGIQIGGDTYEPDASGVVTLPEQGGGAGVPDGGAAGQILIKQSAANGDAIWKTPTADDVGARPDTWTPSAAEVGALPTNGTAADAAKLGGVGADDYLKKSQVVNDFVTTEGGFVADARALKALYDAMKWKTAPHNDEGQCTVPLDCNEVYIECAIINGSNYIWESKVLKLVDLASLYRNYFIYTETASGNVGRATIAIRQGGIIYLSAAKWNDTDVLNSSRISVYYR